jgi:hypothetical protein
MTTGDRTHNQLSNAHVFFLFTRVPDDVIDAANKRIMPASDDDLEVAKFGVVVVQRNHRDFATTQSPKSQRQLVPLRSSAGYADSTLP